MMNGTDVAALQPVRLAPTGVMPIDSTSCNNNSSRRARNAFPSSTNYTPSPFSSSSSSRTTKTNKSKGHGLKRSSSSSPLASAPVKKRQSNVADVAVVTSLPAAATADEFEAFRHQASDTRWDQSLLSGSTSYGGGLDTGPGIRDHFTLHSAALSQTHASAAYDWSFHHSDPVPSSNPSFPLFPSPAPYLAAHENLPHQHPLGDYPVDYLDITPTYGIYPSPLFLNPFHYPAMPVEQRPIPDDATSPQERRLLEYDPLRLAKSEDVYVDDDTQQEGWSLVHRLARRGEWLEEDSKPRTFDDLPQATAVSDLKNGDTSALVEEASTSWEHGLPQVVDEVATDDKRPSSQSERRSRSCLGAEAREKTGKTRKLKACIRCRMQKIRCVEDPEDPDGLHCLTCRRINPNSKKVIHRGPCLRWKLTEVTLFREGGLNLTTRWTGVKMKDLGPRDWAEEIPHPITVTIGCRKKPLVLIVRKIKDDHRDVNWKYWVDNTGAKRRFYINPYALADIRKTAHDYRRYVYNSAGDAFEEYCAGSEVHRVVRDTYTAMFNYYMDCDPHPLKGDDVCPGDFIGRCLRLWFAIRNMLGSAFIVDKDALKLGMAPVDDPECPYHGKFNIPRMIPAQFDSLGYEMVLMPLRKVVLEELWKMMASKNTLHFFAIYLTVFMLLHEVSFTSRDRLRRAVENKMESRYDLVKFVEGLQEGANIVLAHWHYYKRDFNTLVTATKEIDPEKKKAAVWGELKPDQVNLLRQTREAYENIELGPTDWEHDLWFVSQMFEDSDVWRPKDTFRW